MAYRAMGALAHALEVEVRIPTAEGKAPVWAQGPTTACDWIFDIVQAMFRDLMSAKVVSDRDRTEPTGFTNFLAVFALPTPQHTAVVMGDLASLARRLESDLATRFGNQHGTPQVTISPIRTFVTEGSGPGGAYASTGGGGVPTFWTPQPQYAPPPGYQPQWGGGGPPSPPPPPHSNEGVAIKGRSAVMTLGILLGALVIGVVMLGVWSMRLYDSRKAVTEQLGKEKHTVELLKADKAQLEKDLNAELALNSYNEDRRNRLDAMEKELVALIGNRKKKELELPVRPNIQGIVDQQFTTYENKLKDMIKQLKTKGSYTPPVETFGTGGFAPPPRR